MLDRHVCCSRLSYIGYHSLTVLQPSLLIDDGTFEEMDEEALDANCDTIPSPQQEHYGSRPASGDARDRARRWDDDFIDS